MRNGITEAQMGWLAGIIDGEGCFYLADYLDKKGYWYVRIGVTVANTSFAMIAEAKQIIESLIGHSIAFHRDRSMGKFAKKESVKLQINSMPDCSLLTSLLLPYLIAKKRQAEIMVEFCSLGRSFRSKNTPFDFEKRERRRDLIERMKWLNHNPLENEKIASIPARDLTAGSSNRPLRMKEKSDLRSDAQRVSEMQTPVAIN